MKASARPNQVSVSLSPKMKAELERMRREGEIFSVQEFIRRAIEVELERRRAGFPPIDEGAAKTLRRTRTD